ncbi:TRAPP subunit trs31 [Ceratobasidium sp. 392]|nr:TRAPP subunit trs31 [Ceratobasidium sp. 392]
MIQYTQKRVSGIGDLERRLGTLGYRIGTRVLELMVWRAEGNVKAPKREIRFLPALMAIHSQVWKACFGKPADGIEKSVEKEDEYMIIDNDPPITRYISIPKDMDQLSCSALTAGIVEAVLDGLGFPARVTAHSVPMPNLPHRTLILIKLDQSVLDREEAYLFVNLTMDGKRPIWAAWSLQPLATALEHIFLTQFPFMLDATTGFVAAIFTGTLVYYGQLRRRSSAQPNKVEPYGDFHMTLNQSSHSDKGHTEWLNMGFWEDTTDFTVACESLAIKLAQAANCKPGGRVLDVGHATGDSLLLHLTHPEVPTPSYLYGITSLESQHIRAVHRVLDVFQASTAKVQLYLGDAVYRPLPETPPTSLSEVQTLHHPLEPYTGDQTTPTHPTYTSILALDCAYHFKTRERFLVQSIQQLEPKGSIALADICIHSSPATPGLRLLRRIYCVLFSMPPENLITAADYEQTMLRVGYENVSVEDITLSVFPGFTTLLKSRGGGWWVFAWILLVWWKVCGARFVIARGTKPLANDA